MDADILVYEAGFASDSAAKTKGLDHEPLPFAQQNVKNRIKDIMTVTGADTYELYLSGKDNFRFEIYPEYKANRDPSHRPFWYKELKRYCVEELEAIVVDGMEADDILGIRQMDKRVETVIASKDKDLDCVPGLHYNWSPTRWENGVYDITETEALRFFYTQILTGDSTDNIPGLKKLTGKIATAKKKAVLQTLDTAADMYLYVRELYEDVDFTPYAKCLWIMQGYTDVWEPPVKQETPVKEYDNEVSEVQLSDVD